MDGLKRVYALNMQPSIIVLDGIVPRLIFDKSVSVKQISVIEPHGLLILRTDKGMLYPVYFN